MNSEKTDTRVLLLCLTPLHVLTANAINQELGGSKFECGIYLTFEDDEKSRLYAERMRCFCKKVELHIVPSDSSYGRWKYFEIFYRRRRYISWLRAKGKFSSCLIPSSLSHYVYAVPSAYTGISINTYDDGILNIQPESQILSRDRAFSTKIFLIICGIKHWPSRLIKLSQIHFTLYKSKNAYLNTKHINIFSTKSLNSGIIYQHKPHSTIKILLGPPPEASPTIINIFEQATKNIKFDGLLAHPRFTNFSCGKIVAINTNLIAEDYVMQLIDNGQHESIEIYAYESSALINLANVKGVVCYTLINASESNHAMRSLMLECGVRTPIDIQSDEKNNH